MTKRQWMMVSMLVLSVGWIPILFIPAGDKKDAKALLAELPPAYRDGDVKAGQEAFKACISCHTVTEHGQNLNGPNLYRIFGRKAATHADFGYSAALKAKSFAWDAETIDAFIADPQAFAPGSAMAIRGVGDAKTRKDLVAFLKVASS